MLGADHDGRLFVRGDQSGRTSAPISPQAVQTILPRAIIPEYVAEFQFRYNNRDNADIFGAAIAGC